MHIILLIWSILLDWIQPGILSGALPTAETVICHIEGVEPEHILTPELLERANGTLGIHDATGKAVTIIPDHSPEVYSLYASCYSVSRRMI